MQTIKLNEGFDSLRHILKVKQIYPKSKSQVLYETTKYMRRLEFRLDQLIGDNIQLKKLMLTYHYGDQHKNKPNLNLAKPDNTSKQADVAAIKRPTLKRFDQDRKAVKRSPENKREFLNKLLFRKLLEKQKSKEEITQNEESLNESISESLTESMSESMSGSMSPSFSDSPTQLPQTSSQICSEPLNLSLK